MKFLARLLKRKTDLLMTAFSPAQAKESLFELRSEARRVREKTLRESASEKAINSVIKGCSELIIGNISTAELRVRYTQIDEILTDAKKAEEPFKIAIDVIVILTTYRDFLHDATII